MLVLLIDVSVKSVVLAAVAWTMLTMLRVRNANVRHRVWASVLIGMIALPLLVSVTPTVEIPAWLMPSFKTETVAAGNPNPLATPMLEEQRDVRWEPLEPRMEQDDMALADVGHDAARAVQPANVQAMPPDDVGGHDRGTQTASARPGVWATLAPWLKQHASVLALVGYLAVVAAFVLRILAGMWGTNRIVSRATRCVDDPAYDLDRRSPYAVFISKELRVPLTVGFVWPKILLPLEWKQWSPSKLEAILAHEAAHIRRADYLVTLLAEFNRAVHWFNPLSWFLRRHLADLAEQNCDDAVIASTGQRTAYARHLLEVASSLKENKQRVAWSGVAMARRPHVVSRIDAILDDSRPLASRLGLAGALLLLAMVPAVVLTAGLRPRDATAKDQHATGVVAESHDGDAVGAVAQDNATSVGASARRQATEPTRIQGRVVDSDGKGVTAKVYLVSAFAGKAIQPGREQILTSFDTDSTGQFDLMFDMPIRHDRIDIREGPGSRVEQIVAIASGYGPAVKDVIGIREGAAVTLELPTDDVPIEGTVVNLEGAPIAGARLRVAMLGSSDAAKLDKRLADLRVQAGEKPAVAVTAVMRKVFSKAQNQNERLAANKLAYSSLVPRPVTTDADGHFQIDGIGRDRLLALELSGPGIVTSWISVVSRDMRPIQKSAYFGSRTDVTFGAKFQISAEPAQVIEGVARDADTGQPIEGVTLTAESHFGLPTATTDTFGKYRLTGIPRSKRHYLSLSVPGEMPYLSRRRLRIEEFAEGLQPTKLDLELKKTTWVSGTVRDKISGDPVQAHVLFTPHLTSSVAEAYAFEQGEYVDPIRMTYGTHTDDAGRFRVKAIPGDGLLAVVCDDRGYSTPTARHQLSEEWLASDSTSHLPVTTKTFHRVLPGWTHGLKVVTAKANRVVSTEISVDPGNAMEVSLVDSDDRPVSGVSVRNRVPFSWKQEPPTSSSTVTIQGILPDSPRAVLFYQQDRNLGACVLANQNARFQQRKVRLEPCGVVVGQLVSTDGKPLAGVMIGMTSTELASKSYVDTVPYTRTDKAGKFSIERFTPSHAFRLVALQRELTTIAEAVLLKPGEERDLGAITLPGVRSSGQVSAETPRETSSETKAGETVAQSAPFIAASARPAPQSSGQSGARAGGTAPQARKPLIYAGQVLLPNGRPAVGAKIYFNHWRNTARRELKAEVVATTDSQGNYRFERRAESIDAESTAAQLVATLPGYGFAAALAQVFERTGFFDRDDRNRELKQAFLPHDRGPMKLMVDNGLIHGRIVDLEGTGIRGARVAVMSVWANVANDSSTWDEAIKNPKLDYLTLDNLFRRQIRGPEVASMLPSATTGENGRFIVRGLGKHRIAKLVVTGENIEATSFFVRADAAETMTVPFQFGSQGMPGQESIFHGNQFTHVLSPSRPVVGRVVDVETGEPIAGALVHSQRMWTSTFDGTKPILTRSGSNIAWAVTDADGRYRLEGLPRAKSSFVRVLGGSSYLASHSQADTSGNRVEPVTLDLELRRGMVLEGRVTDASTGEGLQGSIDFLPDGNDRRAIPMVGGGHQKRSDAEGRFRIVVAKQDGQLCFTAFKQHLYVKHRLQGRGEERSPTSVSGFRASAEFHVIHPVRAETSQTSIQLKARRTSVVVGRAVDMNEKPVRDLLYVGFAQGSPHWMASPDGALKVYGLKASESRVVAVVCQPLQLAGFVDLDGAKDGFTVKLQPWAMLKGRIVNADGQALGHARLVRSNVFSGSFYSYSSEMAIQDVKAFRESLPLPPVRMGRRTVTSHTTDEDGRFAIAGLVPGHAYGITAFHQTNDFTTSHAIASDLKLQPGVTHDLGEVVLANSEEGEAERIRSAQSSP